MPIEKLVFTSWSDAEVIFALDWKKFQKAAINTCLEDKDELCDFLREVSTFALAETIGKDLNLWGTYRATCEEFGEHLFNGSLGLTFVDINLPDIELADEPDVIPIDNMPKPPEQPSW